MKRLIYTLVILCIGVAQAQNNCSFTHYSSEDGLSQNTVMSILQDRKGAMWFSTWDGLNMFNGYTFKTYKASQGSQISLTNNRVDRMYEDKYGYLWLLTYDNRVHRFNPSTETFEQVPDSGEGTQLNIVSINLLANGTVWLLTEKEGAIRVNTDAKDYSLTSTLYSVASGLFPSNRYYAVHLDRLGNEWLLTDNGLGVIKAGEEKPTTYFVSAELPTENADQSFFSFAESDKELLFGSRSGRIWRFQKEEERFQLSQLPTRSRIIAIHAVAPEEFLIATHTDGFFVHNFATRKSSHFTAATHKELLDIPIYSVYVDKTNEVWFEQNEPGCVVHFNPRTQQLKREQLKVEPAAADRSHPSFHVHEDIRGRVWVHPFGGGLSYFDKEKNTLIPFYNEPGSKEWRFSNKVHSVFSDSQGNLWMGTHSKGLEKVTFQPMHFHQITPYPTQQESLSNEVRSLMEDKRKNLWVGLKNGELRLYNCNKEYIGYLTEEGIIAKSGRPIRGVAYDLLQDRQGVIWISTKGEGLIRAERKAGKENAFRITRYKYNAEDIYSLSNDNVYCAYEDMNGRIWVATFAGGLNYIEKDKEGNTLFINHRNHLKGYPIDNYYKVRFVTSDKKGRIWVGTTTGAISFNANFTAPESIVFNQYSRIPSDPNSLSNNDIHWIINTKQDEIYLAAFGGGLNKLTSMDEEGNATFKSYTVQDGLPSDVLLSILEDEKSNLWISTEHGVSRFTPASESFENYDDRSIMFHVRFNEAASAVTSSGDVMFGASTGVFYFNPDSISKSNFVPPIVLSAPLNDKERLVLNHDENNLSVQYAALDYTNPANIQYAFRLEGIDKDWNYVDKLRGTTYTNLAKGNYTFNVKSTNSDGVWVDNVRSLQIEVLPSFWETPWAYMLYLALIVLFIWAAVYILFTIYRLKHEVSVEQQISDIKLRFFTNISHELRTPLTLIAGPVECVLQNRNLPADAREQLLVVERNTTRMLRLVNQILDFRKIQNKKMKMQVQKVEIIPFVRKVMASFDSLAEENQIDYILETEKEDFYLWVDEDKLEKIIFNLLSNAFKYTPIGKMIKVFVREEQTTISIEVRDQGIGIAENKKNSIFVRFENLVDKNLFNQSASTGIGLSLVKELVEMHEATITVNSKLGEGSGFKIEFLKGKEHYDETTEFIVADTETASFEEVEKVSAGEKVDEEPAVTTTNKVESQKVLLLVEDNLELRTFLRGIFADKFSIIEAVNGVEGYNKALTFLPDIIISDIMMPEKDGIEMMKGLRADMKTSHIPIVLLTAKTSIEDKIAGLEYGADDYITKPFSATYLKARIENILSQREKLQEMYRSSLMSESSVTVKAEEENVQQPEMTTIDRKFMDKLMELMEKNMDNGELMVDDLVAELAVSRSVFFKKLKTLTGLAPIEFIKEVRIKRAAQLIETGEFNMTQISYMVGINDPRYFSKCFKQKIGMTPTEFKEQLKA